VSNFLDFLFSIVFFGANRWVVIGYAATLVAGTVLSFTIRRRRRAIRIAACILSIPLWLFISVWVYIIFVLFKEPPTLRDLKARFPSRRTDLETILTMADEDKDFSRIAPDFVDRESNVPGDGGTYDANDPRAKLLKARWDAYRKLFSRSATKPGFQRDSTGDIFIIAGAVGFLNNGHSTGYLHCVSPSLPEVNRFGACTHQDQQNGHSVGNYSGDDKYAFENLGDSWFVYDEGPAVE
jgi:hypothetical protein